MSEATLERDVLERMMPELEAEGYDVFLHPDRRLLPPFLKDHVPQAIARRSDRNLVIEVARTKQERKRKKEKIAELLAGRKDWELRLVWVQATSSAAPVQLQRQPTVKKKIQEIKVLARDGHFDPALLMAWATLEAIGRLLATGRLERPQTPGRLVEVLAHEGYLTPSEADDLRLLADKRNALIHGGLDARVTQSEVERFAAVLGTLVKMIGK